MFSAFVNSITNIFSSSSSSSSKDEEQHLPSPSGKHVAVIGPQKRSRDAPGLSKVGLPIAFPDGGHHTTEEKGEEEEEDEELQQSKGHQVVEEEEEEEEDEDDDQYHHHRRKRVRPTTIPVSSAHQSSTEAEDEEEQARFSVYAAITAAADVVAASSSVSSTPTPLPLPLPPPPSVGRTSTNVQEQTRIPSALILATSPTASSATAAVDTAKRHAGGRSLRNWFREIVQATKQLYLNRQQQQSEATSTASGIATQGGQEEEEQQQQQMVAEESTSPSYQQASSSSHASSSSSSSSTTSTSTTTGTSSPYVMMIAPPGGIRNIATSPLGSLHVLRTLAASSASASPVGTPTGSGSPTTSWGTMTTSSATPGTTFAGPPPPPLLPLPRLLVAAPGIHTKPQYWKPKSTTTSTTIAAESSALTSSTVITAEREENPSGPTPSSSSSPPLARKQTELLKGWVLDPSHPLLQRKNNSATSASMMMLPNHTSGASSQHHHQNRAGQGASGSSGSSGSPSSPTSRSGVKSSSIKPVDEVDIFNRVNNALETLSGFKSLDKTQDQLDFLRKLFPGTDDTLSGNDRAAKKSSSLSSSTTTSASTYKKDFTSSSTLSSNTLKQLSPLPIRTLATSSSATSTSSLKHDKLSPIMSRILQAKDENSSSGNGYGAFSSSPAALFSKHQDTTQSNQTPLQVVELLDDSDNEEGEEEGGNEGETTMNISHTVVSPRDAAWLRLPNNNDSRLHDADYNTLATVLVPDKVLTQASVAFRRHKKGIHEIIGSCESETVTIEKIQCLRDGCWLNDEVINFYMKHLFVTNKREYSSSSSSGSSGNGNGNSTLVTPSEYGGCSNGRSIRSNGSVSTSPTPPKNRIWVTSSYFMARLLGGGGGGGQTGSSADDDDNNNESGYNYANVARWSVQAGVDIANIDLVLVPINTTNTHWALAVLDVRTHIVHYYDSLIQDSITREVPIEDVLYHLHGDGDGDEKKMMRAGNGSFRYEACVALARWACDEWRTRHGIIMDLNSSSGSGSSGSSSSGSSRRWMIHMYSNRIVPQQRNSYDCGLFMCAYARCIAKEIPWDFTQEDAKFLRRDIALQIIASGRK